MTKSIEEQAMDDKEVPVLTAEDVKKALEESAKKADETNDQLRDVFSLSEASANLRLR